MCNIRVENYVLFGQITEDLSPGDNLSVAPRDCSEGVREEPRHTGDFAGSQKPGSQNIKRFLFEEKQAISSKRISCFSVYGKIQESRLMEMILRICTQSSRPSSLFSILSPLCAQSGAAMEAAGLMAAPSFAY